MKVVINGEEKDLPHEMNVMELLNHLRVKYREIGLAVSVNGEIVPKSDYHSYLVKEGDKVEIIHLVGGG